MIWLAFFFFNSLELYVLFWRPARSKAGTYVKIVWLFLLTPIWTQYEDRKINECIPSSKITINSKYSLSGLDRKSINSLSLSIPSSVIELASFVLVLLLLWLEFEAECLVFLWKFHRNCFGLSVEQSTLKKKILFSHNSQILYRKCIFFLLCNALTRQYLCLQQTINACELM